MRVKEKVIKIFYGILFWIIKSIWERDVNDIIVNLSILLLKIIEKMYI